MTVGESISISESCIGCIWVVFYAGLFVCIDLAYNVFEREVLTRADATWVSEGTRRMRGADHWLFLLVSRSLCWLRRLHRAPGSV